MRLKLIIGIVLLLIVNSIFSQNYNFINYSSNEGLAQSQVNDIKQDKNNYLWIATFDGLSRFDGKSFKNYTKKDGLVSNNITSLFVDEFNRIWVVTKNGISIIVEDSIQSFSLNHLLTSVDLREIVILKDKMWLSTFKSGIFQFQLYDEVSETKLSKEFRQDFNGLKIRDISILSSKLYVGTDKGVLVLENGSFEKFPFFQDLYVTAIAENSRGELWVGTLEDGIFSVSNKAVKSINMESSQLQNGYIKNLFIDRKDKIWTCSNLVLSEIASNDELVNYNPDNGFDYNPEVVFEDKEGIIWIGTNGKGLLKFANKEFLFLTKERDFQSDIILSVGEDKSGDIWLGSLGEGVYKLNNGTIIEYDARNSSLPNNYIWTSLLDKEKKLWLGTSQGLCYFENNEFVTFTKRDGVPSDKVQSLFQEVRDVLWIGTNDGVAYMKNNRFYQLDSFPYTNVRSIASTQDGLYWFGTNQGLVKYDGFEAKLIEDSLFNDNRVFTVVTNGNKLWAGSEKGLIYYNGSSFSRFNFSQENNKGAINFLLIDKNNFLWIGTNKGVFTLNLQAYKNGETEIRSYTTNNGLIGMETNLNAIHQDSEGNIWFGTSEGVNVYQGANKPEEKFQPSIHLTNVKLFFEEENWLKKLSSGKAPSFGYKKNTFTFYYHTNYFKDPNKTRYSYMLKGIDDSWSPMETSNFSRYPNLPNGDYTFLVKSTIDGKNWSNTATVDFSISAPFWLTWPFRILVLIVLSLTIYYFLNRRRNAQKKQREVEFLSFKNKFIKLEQQSLNASMNRHFIFNSLNSIQFYINKEDKLSANKYLSNFSKLIRKNLDSSSHEDSLIPLSEEIDRLELYLSLENMRFKEKFSYEINLDNRVDAELTKVPAMFMQPFVENSIWHGILPKEEKGKININIFKKEDKTHFEIIDNGIGINTSIKNKQNEQNEHTSQGMKIAENRIDLLQKIINRDISVHGPEEIIKDGKVFGTKVEIIFG